MHRAIWQKMWAILGALVALLLLGTPAHAANCNYATAQGATGPTNWQTYCWLDLTSYNDTTARSAAGQFFSYALPDGSTMTFTMKVSGATATSATSPSWTGAAVGNTAFLGIGGRPVLYQTAAGTTTVTFSGITVAPPAGGVGGSTFMFVAGDAESSNGGESLSFQTNGAGWIQVDQAGPVSGATYPGVSGVGTATVTETGVGGTVGAYIFGSTSPTQVTTTMVGGGLQGSMFAVRFASIRLNLQISGARADPTDQFKYDIAATASGSVLSTSQSSGTALGPFGSAALASTSALPLTLKQSMVAGSASTLSHYRSVLTCTNGSAGSSTPLPSGVVTTAYNFGALQFGDNIQCTYVNTPYPHLTLVKALGAGGRQFAGDQFTLTLSQGATSIATTTTTGTGATVTNAATPQTQVSPATTYTFGESASGTTVLSQYTATMACTNAAASSATALPNAPGGAITPQMGDVVTCTITNTRRAANATLTIAKTSTVLSDPLNGTTNPKAIPGAIILYSLAVTNTGPSAVDGNTVVLIDALPSQILVGSASSPVLTQGATASGLTFTVGTDIRYSNSASAPASFAACTYSPVSAYDPAVKFVCLNPKGTMAGSTGSPPGFTITLQGQLL